MIEVKKYRHEDAADATRIWNRVVEDAKAFPQTECIRGPVLLGAVLYEDCLGQRNRRHRGTVYPASQ